MERPNPEKAVDPHVEARTEAQTRQRSTADKIALFRRRFSGLDYVYGTYDPGTGRACQVKAPVTETVILSHLQGKKPYGVYLLVNDKTRAAAVDFDHDDPLPVLEFVDAARHYGLPAYVERSKSKGYHLWLFFDEGGVLAAKARAVIRRILEEIGAAGVEVFPKQDSLGVGTFYGNFINAPLFGALVPNGRTVFVDPAVGLRPFPDQWEVLANVELISERKLDEIIEMNGISPGSRPFEPVIQRGEGSTAPRGGLAPCARRMLQEGVRENQRVACFRLAIHLRKKG